MKDAKEAVKDAREDVRSAREALNERIRVVERAAERAAELEGQRVRTLFCWLLLIFAQVAAAESGRVEAVGFQQLTATCH